MIDNLPKVVFDISDPSICCDSLGNCVVQAYAIRRLAEKEEVRPIVKVGPFYPDLWRCFFVSTDIRYPREDPATGFWHHAETRLPSDVTKTYYSRSHAKEIIDHQLGFYQAALCDLGVPPEECKTEICSPVMFWPHQSSGLPPGKQRVLIYPREFDNKNRYFDRQFWVDLCRLISSHGHKIICIWHYKPHRRDYDDNSQEFCEYVERASGSKFLKLQDSIEGLVTAIAMSSLAVGRLNGPGWLLLRSTIPQVLLDSPEDHQPTQKAIFNAPLIAKPVSVLHSKEHILGWAEFFFSRKD